MTIVNCNSQDIENIFRLYRLASGYQRSKQKVVVWPEFHRELIQTEIEENRQWKLQMDESIACDWATTFSDEFIWEERNADAAVYIHRIVTDPEYRGNNFVAHIIEWAREYAAKHKKQYIRLDTLGNNTKLISHYTKAGFDFLGLFELKNTSNLPSHYQENKQACLFEIKI